MRALPRSAVIGALLIVSGLGVVAAAFVTGRMLLVAPGTWTVIAGIAILLMADLC